MADTWRTVWHGALKSPRAAGKTGDVMKRFPSHAGSLLKVIECITSPLMDGSVCLYGNNKISCLSNALFLSGISVIMIRWMGWP